MKICFSWLGMIFVVIFTLASTQLMAQGRHKNLDFVFIIDKSLSMRTKIDHVENYIDEHFLRDRVIVGDTVTIVVFFGKASLVDSKVIRKASDLQVLKQKIDLIQADGRWTDIGNAIDFAQAWVKTHIQPDLQSYYLLFTDGRQEAPPGSKYVSSDYKIIHPFLVHSIKSEHQGWERIVVDVEDPSVSTEIATLAGQIAQNIGLTKN
jgi:Mg-chelatase subunit ChlD